MLMSIFSSFDILCAESVGRKVSSSWPPAASNKQEDAVKVDDLNSGREEKPPSKDRRRMRAPGFAPELDGINYFETILPY